MLSGTLFSPSFNYFIDLLEIVFGYSCLCYELYLFTTSFLKYLSMAFMKTNNFSRGFLGGSVVRTCLPVQETQVRPQGQEDSLEKGMANHFSILAWEIPWTGEPGGLQLMGTQELDMT